jgi:hypothetical protein
MLAIVITDREHRFRIGVRFDTYAAVATLSHRVPPIRRVLVRCYAAIQISYPKAVRHDAVLIGILSSHPAVRANFSVNRLNRLIRSSTTPF